MLYIVAYVNKTNVFYDIHSHDDSDMLLVRSGP